MTLVPGIRPFLRSRIRSGLNPVDGQAWDIDPTSGKPLPSTLQQWQAFLAAKNLPIATPTSLYLCQEPTGDIKDQIGGFDLAPGGSGHSYTQSVSGWARKAITLTDGTAGRWANTSSSLPDISTTSCTLLAYVLMPPSIPASTRTFAYLGGSTCTVRINATTGYLSTLSEANLVSGSENLANTGVRPVALTVDRTAGTQTAYTDAEELALTLGSVTGQACGLGGPATAGGTGYLYAVRWDGADGEISAANMRALLDALEWS